MKKIFVLAKDRKAFQAECERIFSNIELDIAFERKFDGLEISMGDVTFFYVTKPEMLQGARGHLYIMSGSDDREDWQRLSHLAGAKLSDKSFIEWRPKK